MENREIRKQENKKEINFEQIRLFLPQDMLDQIASFLSPKICTILSKKFRDFYFTQNGLFIDFPQDGVPVMTMSSITFLSKYRITLDRFYDRKLCKIERIICKKANKITNAIIRRNCDLDELFSDPETFSGYVIGNKGILQKINRVKNQLVIIIATMEIFRYYKQLDLTNLIRIATALNIPHVDLYGWEEKINYCRIGLLAEDKIYTNLETVEGEYKEILNTKVKIPNIRNINLFWTTLYHRDDTRKIYTVSELAKKYTTVDKIKIGPHQYERENNFL